MRYLFHLVVQLLQVHLKVGTFHLIGFVEVRVSSIASVAPLLVGKSNKLFGLSVDDAFKFSAWANRPCHGGGLDTNCLFNLVYNSNGSRLGRSHLLINVIIGMFRIGIPRRAGVCASIPFAASKTIPASTAESTL